MQREQLAEDNFSSRSTSTSSSLKERLITNRGELLKQLGLTNPMQLPRIEKVVLNMGVGREIANSKALEEVVKELTLIAGQAPYQTKAKNSLASFKLREGMSMGAAVTLRGERMWSFLTKLAAVVLPRVRDFRGLNPNSFDQNGNFSLGIKEQIVFPEINFEDVRRLRGLDVTIVINSPSAKASLVFLKSLGFPFAERGGKE